MAGTALDHVCGNEFPGLPINGSGEHLRCQGQGHHFVEPTDKIPF